MIPDDIFVEPPLDSSDHVMLSFNFQCYTKQTHVPRTKYKYDKADFANMSADMNLDWEKLLEGKNANEAWKFFKTSSKHLYISMYLTQNQTQKIKSNRSHYGCRTKH